MFIDNIRNIDIKDPNNLITYPAEGIDTCLKAFRNTGKKFKNNNFMGTRDDK